MRVKLLLFALLAVMLPSLARAGIVSGTVVNSATGSPVSGAFVMLRDAALSTTTGFNGYFEFRDVPESADLLAVSCDGMETLSLDVNVPAEGSVRLGELRMAPAEYDLDYYGDSEDMLFDESVLEDEESSAQGVAALTGASDDIYYNTASYNFGPMYFRYRGYDSQYQAIYINGVKFNDLIRGRFGFSNVLMGMTSRAFRNKTTTAGIQASNYMLRGMVTYASGVNSKGWAYTVSAIGRYAKEGVIDGTFYNSGAVFLSLEKIFNPSNSLTLTVWGGPTQRATARPTYQEAYDLMDDNLYNPSWGWQDGKKRSERITETWDPTAMLNWLYKKGSTTVNTAAALHYAHYNRTALQFYKANDPKPDYYRYLPSYYFDDGKPTAQSELYTELWKSHQISQIDWDNLYQINYLNNIQNQTLPEADKKGASYIMENRTNNTVSAMFNSYINTQLNRYISLQGGVSFNYTNQSNYKTVRDLMGAEFWLDVDPFSDRDITIAPQNLINDLDNPYARVKKGDKFGYDYSFYALQAEAWLQNVITLPKWDINYGMKVSYTQFQRDGHMRNGRAPEDSKGKGKLLKFDNAGFKFGATYKINGRNQLMVHGEYGTRAPLADQVYVAPRVKNATVANPSSERDLALDASYVWNYRRFRGTITGFYTLTDNAIERNGFYDDRYNTYTNYVLSDVKRVYKGIELGMAFKVTPSVTATFAGMYSRFQYKNNPQGTRTFENGLYADTTQTVYLKNYFVGSTPQYAANLGIDWAAPGNWFFNVNATVQGDAYVNLSPAYHEELPTLVGQLPTLQQQWQAANPGQELPDAEMLLADKIAELSTQDKLKNAFTLNASIGKLVYINRSVSLNFNLSVNNILNNRNVVTNAYQQGRLDVTDFNRLKYPNKYSYAQGVRVFFNVGVRF